MINMTIRDCSFNVLKLLFIAGKPEKRLVLFYLANDVVQNGRKKAKDLLQILVESFKEAMGLLW